jgi:hypothetical protein
MKLTILQINSQEGRIMHLLALVNIYIQKGKASQNIITGIN